VSRRWRKADHIFQFGLFTFVGLLYDYLTFLGNEEARKIVKPHMQVFLCGIIKFL